MVLERDQIMLDWLNMFKIATPQQLNQVAYNNMDACYRRLRKLYSDKLIRREKNTIGLGYVYSTARIRSMQQAQHSFIRNEFYLKLNNVSIIKEVMVEKVFGSVRPDAVFMGLYNNKPYFFFVEVETNSNKHRVNTDKYNNFFLSEWREYLKTKPIVIYVTDKTIVSNSNFEYRKINTKLDKFETIFN